MVSKKVGMTLCWNCRNAVPSVVTGVGCSWSRHYQPVPGWEAIQDSIYIGPAKPAVPTYHVIRCPEFRADRIEQKKEAEQMRRRTWDTKRAEQLRSEGKSDLDIADMVGVSVSTIRAYFKRPSGGAEHAAPVSGPPPASESGQDPDHPPEEDPADDAPLDTKHDDEPFMPAGVLAELLYQVDPGTSVEYDGEKVRGLGINRTYGPDGKVDETYVYLW